MYANPKIVWIFYCWSEIQALKIGTFYFYGLTPFSTRGISSEKYVADTYTFGRGVESLAAFRIWSQNIFSLDTNIDISYFQNCLSICKLGKFLNFYDTITCFYINWAMKFLKFFIFLLRLYNSGAKKGLNSKAAVLSIREGNSVL